MSLQQLELQAEREKLARLLETPPGALRPLEPLGVLGLRQVRGAVAAHLFDRDAARFRGLARSTKLLPARVVALIAQKALGPRLAAHVAGLLEPKTAVALAQQVEIDFQADLCLFLDPAHAGEVLRAMPVDLVVETSRELLARAEYMTMARFVDDLRDDQIQAVTGILDPRAMLWIGFYVESGTRLSQLIARLDDAQLLATYEAASAEELWPQGLAMLARADEATARRVCHLFAQAEAELLPDLLAAAEQQDLMAEVAQITRAAEADDLERLRERLRAHDPAVLSQLEAALDD